MQSVGSRLESIHFEGRKGAGRKDKLKMYAREVKERVKMYVRVMVDSEDETAGTGLGLYRRVLERADSANAHRNSPAEVGVCVPLQTVFVEQFRS
jgi:hypothetical protein